VKLYRSVNPTPWYAIGPDPLDVRAVPLRRARNAAIFATHTSADLALEIPFSEAA
jgi:hypothetical protein